LNAAVSVLMLGLQLLWWCSSLKSSWVMSSLDLQ